MGNNPNSKEDLKLSNNEINSIKSTWEDIKTAGLAELGVGLMTRIMIEHKEIKSMWRKRPGVSNENVDYSNPNQAVKNHGEKVFNVIGTVIDSVDDLAKVSPDLNKMGYDHYKFGTRVEHFQMIGEALISTIGDALREKFKEDVKKAWLKLFGIIECQMRLGMSQGEAEA